MFFRGDPAGAEFPLGMWSFFDPMARVKSSRPLKDLQESWTGTRHSGARSRVFALCRLLIGRNGDECMDTCKSAAGLSAFMALIRLHSFEFPVAGDHTILQVVELMEDELGMATFHCTNQILQMPQIFIRSLLPVSFGQLDEVL